MSALVERLWYNVKDAVRKKSYAESQRDKYKKAIDKINQKLDCMTDFEDTVEILERDISSMESNLYSADGKFHWTFKQKEANNRMRIRSLGATYRVGIAEVRKQLGTVQTEYEYWCSEAEREDREMKQYEKQYYDAVKKEKNKRKGV